MGCNGRVGRCVSVLLILTGKPTCPTTTPTDDAAVLCPRCKANYLLLPHGAIGPRSRPGSSASHHSHHSGVGATTPVACACGLRVELCAPGMGLAQLQERLAAVYGHHRCVRLRAGLAEEGVVAAVVDGRSRPKPAYGWTTGVLMLIPFSPYRHTCTYLQRLRLPRPGAQLLPARARAGPVGRVRRLRAPRAGRLGEGDDPYVCVCVSCTVVDVEEG